MDEELWHKFLSCIEENIGTAKFSTWFEPLKYLGTQGKSLRIQLPNRFTREWLREHYLPLMVQTARELSSAEIMIQIVVGENLATLRLVKHLLSFPQHLHRQRRPRLRPSRNRRLINGSPSRRSWSDLAIAWRKQPVSPSPSGRRMPITHCFCMGG